MLDIIGKVVARVLQETEERLQKLAVDELLESQCGLIFVVRQVIEMSWEHESKAFVTFVLT